MARIKIKINEQEYPCYFTLGAGLEFKQIIGHDISKMDTTDLVEAGTLLYCQCKSACRREKIDFPYGYEDFMDQVTDMDLFAVLKEQEDPAKKK